MIAALFVHRDGPYYGLPDVDPWDEARDARLYMGPHPVVAHPPCQRWGRYWHGGPSARVPRKRGDDGGCFESALAAVRRFGGILEHPEASSAWGHFGLNSPPRHGGWIAADFEGGWTCCVEQGHYGHPARKATWLYAHGVDTPSLIWGPCPKRARLDEGFHSAEERRRAVKTGIVQRLSARQRIVTPIPFRDLLLSIARTARPFISETAMPANTSAVTKVIPRKRTLPKLEVVRRDLQELIAFYKDQKPDVRRVFVSPDAWERIRTSPIAVREGFVIAGGCITFDGFELIRTASP